MNAIRELTDEARRSMLGAGLSEGYVASLASTWRALDGWLSRRGVPYSPEVEKDFLRDEYGIADDGIRADGVGRRRRRALAVLRNCYEHRPYRRVEDRRYESRFRACHEKQLDAFLDGLRARYSESTLCGYVHMLNKLSPFLEEAGVADLSDVGAGDFARFVKRVADGGVGQQTIYATTCRLRRLASWLESTGRAEPGLAELVPKAKAPEPKPPDVYADDEVEAVIRSVDAAGPTGKRDLVACLLAARLGMRSSDIVALRFENLLWREGSISFASAKTGRPTVLPLTNEVGSAIVAYLKDGRPESSEPYVLLRHNPPYTRMRPARVHGIVSEAMSRAGIAKDGRRRGPHALRASVATRMMRNGTPLPVISEALSHDSSETSRSYLKADAATLRGCALDVPPLVNTWWPTGALR